MFKRSDAVAPSPTLSLSFCCDKDTAAPPEPSLHDETIHEIPDSGARGSLKHVGMAPPPAAKRPSGTAAQRGPKGARPPSPLGATARRLSFSSASPAGHVGSSQRGDPSSQTPQQPQQQSHEPELSEGDEEDRQLAAAIAASLADVPKGGSELRVAGVEGAVGVILLDEEGELPTSTNTVSSGRNGCGASAASGSGQSKHISGRGSMEEGAPAELPSRHSREPQGSGLKPKASGGSADLPILIADERGSLTETRGGGSSGGNCSRASCWQDGSWSLEGVSEEEALRQALEESAAEAAGAAVAKAAINGQAAPQAASRIAKSLAEREEPPLDLSHLLSDEFPAGKEAERYELQALVWHRGHAAACGHYLAGDLGRADWRERWDVSELHTRSTARAARST